LKIGIGNTFQVDPETGATSKKGVYAGGDSVSGPASVIEAIAAARKATSAIDKYLGGSGDITEELVKNRSFNLNVGKCADFTPKTRMRMAELGKAQRAGTSKKLSSALASRKLLPRANAVCSAPSGLKFRRRRCRRLESKEHAGRRR